MLRCMVFIAVSMLCGVIAAQEQTVQRSISVGGEPSIALCENGTPCVEIVLPEKSPAVTAFAAEELRSILSQSLGGSVPVVRTPDPVKTSIVLGDCEFSRAAGISAAGIPRDGFIIRTSGNDIYIVGSDNPKTDIDLSRNLLSIWANYFERGTLNGVYDFLERFCGVRFYFPGELGTVVPEYKNFKISQVNILERPDYTVRLYAWHKGEWFDKSPVWGKDGVRAKTLNLYRTRHETQYLPCNHGLLAMNYPARFAKTHPEYFSIVDGRRSYADKHPYLCFSSGIVEEIYQDAKTFFEGKDMSARGAVNQYGQKRWDPSACQEGYFNIMPQDGFRMCECPQCSAIKSKLPVPGVPDKEISDHIWKMTAGIAQRLKDEGIKGNITQMAYWPYNKVPDFELPDNIRVMVGVTGPWRPEDRNDLIPSWSRKLKSKVWLWTYAGKFGARALPGFPSSTPRAIGKYYGSKAPWIFGAYMESDTDRFLFNYLNYYVFGKVMWDTKTDVDALLDEHYRLMYGKAAPVMKQIFEQIESDWLTRLSGEYVENANGVFYQFPSEYRIWHDIYPPARLKGMEEMYDRALKLAETDLQRRRITLMKSEFLGGILEQNRLYRNTLRQSEEWSHCAPELPAETVFASDGAPEKNVWGKITGAYLHKVPNGENTAHCVKMASDGEKLHFTVCGVPFQEIELIISGKTFRFAGDYMAIPLKELGGGPFLFDAVRRQDGRITERWNFFLDSETTDSAAFGRLVVGKAQDGNIISNGDLTGSNVEPWFGPRYADGDKGVYIDRDIFLAGGQSFRLESNGKFSTSAWQNLPSLKPNTRYRITFYVRLENVVPFDSGGGVISSCFDQVNRYYPAGPLTGTIPWTKQCNEITTGPETNQKHKSYFNVSLRNASGKAWIDNIRIYEINDKEKDSK